MAFTYIGEVNAVNSASGTTLSTPATSHVTGNHLFVHVVFSSTGAATTTVTDTAGNTYTPLTQSQATGQLIFGQWFYCLNITGNASNVVTATMNSARSNRVVRVLQFSSASAVFDKEVIATSDVATSISTASFNTLRDGIVLVGEVNWNSETSTSFGANYTGLVSIQNYSKEAYRITTGALTGEVVTYSDAVSTQRSLQVVSIVAAPPASTATHVFKRGRRPRIHLG